MSSFGPEGLERRRAPRVPMPPKGGSIAVVGGRVVNVSPFGMMIESLVPIERDAVLEVRLVVAGEKVDVGTRVAACSVVVASRRRKIYGIGLEFTRIADATRQRIGQVLSSAPQQPARTA